MTMETGGAEIDAIGQHTRKIAATAGLRRLYAEWSEELRLRAWADYYADLFIGASIALVGTALFVAWTIYLFAIARGHSTALAVVLRCVSWEVSGACILLGVFFLAGRIMRMQFVLRMQWLLKWAFYAFGVSAIFGLIGVIPFAFIKFG